MVSERGKLRPSPRVCQLYERTYRNDKFPHLTFYAEMRWSLNATITGAAIFTITLPIHQPVPPSPSSTATPSGKINDGIGEFSIGNFTVRSPRMEEIRKEDGTTMDFSRRSIREWTVATVLFPLLLHIRITHVEARYVSRIESYELFYN